MFHSKPIIHFSLLAFSLFLVRTFEDVYKPRVLGHSCFKRVQFPANGYYQDNLNTLLTQVVLSKEITDSEYKAGIINATSTSITEQNTSVSSAMLDLYYE